MKKVADHKKKMNKSLKYSLFISIFFISSFAIMIDTYATDIQVPPDTPLPLTIRINPTGTNSIPEKIAVFLYDTAVCSQKTIERYIKIIISRGFTTIFLFPDMKNPFDGIYSTADYEGPEDQIFFYLAGHGDKSSVYLFEKDDVFNGVLYYRTFALTLAHSFEAMFIGVLLDSCHSGAFIRAVEDLEIQNCVAISSSDADELSYRFPTVCECFFSYAFFNHLRDESRYANLNSAFSDAREYVCNPLVSYPYFQYELPIRYFFKIFNPNQHAQISNHYMGFFIGAILFSY